MDWFYGDIKIRRRIHIIAFIGSISIIVSVALHFTMEYFSVECERKVSDLEHVMASWYRQNEWLGSLVIPGRGDEGNNIVAKGYSVDQECGWLYGSVIKDKVQTFEGAVQ